MTANELRIGNWVYLKTHNRITKVKNLGLRKINHGFTNKDYDGIPLTPEILEKCGFEKDVEIDNFKKREFTIFIRKYNISISNNHGYLANVQYLHQLQNLYFALTGEELEIIKPL